ncbi:MAG: Flp pilus assembly complex ATPase component TadA [Planctomycetes bacterium]|nr:Flp pilus assembly complex ATPase component TadA [Planctomycetota bacterium]
MDDRLADALVRTGLLTREEIPALQARATANEPLHRILIRDGRVSENDVAESFSLAFSMPYVRLSTVSVDPMALKLVPDSFARTHHCFPIQFDGGCLILAVDDPLNLVPEQEISMSKGVRVRSVLATRTAIEDALTRHYEAATEVADFLKGVEFPHADERNAVEVVQEPSSADPVDLKEVSSEPIVKLTSMILGEAIRRRASDIHVEPTVANVRVRYRIDGVLENVLEVPKWLQNNVISRYKVMSNMDITERRVPQDGRIKTRQGTRAVDVRVSTLPTHYGEKIVMRILDGSQANVSLDKLGFEPPELAILQQAVRRPQGLVLTTGPTGSGKSSTLFACLNTVKSPKINIITVEDPIEFENPGLNQVQINDRAGLTFAATLRSVLRQDPNVILVGEIRDRETAEIALQAANTGHLVFSTLHTNDSVATITRLINLNVNSAVLASGLVLVMAQRLVRRLCEACKEPASPLPAMMERLGMTGNDPSFQGRGCPACNGTGFKGRCGVYEMLPVDRTLKDLITTQASEAAIRQAAIAAGLRPLVVAAAEKVKAGITSVEEVLRVIELSDDTGAKCPNCRRSIEEDFAQCPFCGCSLRKQCPSCGQSVRPEWSMCPYCRGSALLTPGGTGTVEGPALGRAEADTATAVESRKVPPAAGPAAPGATASAAAAAPSAPARPPATSGGGTAWGTRSGGAGTRTPLPQPLAPRPPVPPQPVQRLTPPSTPAPAPAALPAPAPSVPCLPDSSPAAGAPDHDSDSGSTSESLPVPGLERPRILVVDDNDEIRSLICLFLRRFKYPVDLVTATNGRKALEEIRRRRPSLILLDYMMPEMDGMEVCKLVRSDLSTAFIPILMMTADKASETRARAVAVGTDDFISKPIQPNEFEQKIERLLLRTYGL